MVTTVLNGKLTSKSQVSELCRMFLQNVCCLPHFLFLLPKHFTLFQLTTESLSHPFVILEMHCMKKGRVWAVFKSLWLLSSCSAIRFRLSKRFLKLSCRSSPVLGHLPETETLFLKYTIWAWTLFIPNVWNVTITKWSVFWKWWLTPHISLLARFRSSAVLQFVACYRCEIKTILRRYKLYEKTIQFSKIWLKIVLKLCLIFDILFIYFF